MGWRTGGRNVGAAVPRLVSKGMRARGTAVAVALLTVVALVTGATAVVGWRLVDGIRSASSDSLPLPVDAVVVFAGEDRRFELGRELVEEGRAPVLVLSAGRLPKVAAGWCEAWPFGGDSPDSDRRSVEVVCLTPDPSSTAGEAAAFAELAAERGWGSVLAVTGDYHAQRASMLLSRCYDGDVSWALVDWPSPSWSLTLSELTKTVGDWVVSRIC